MPISKIKILLLNAITVIARKWINMFLTRDEPQIFFQDTQLYSVHENSKAQDAPTSTSTNNGIKFLSFLKGENFYSREVCVCLLPYKKSWQVPQDCCLYCETTFTKQKKYEKMTLVFLNFHMHVCEISQLSNTIK